MLYTVEQIKEKLSTNDNRCDSIVKEEIYLDYIKNEYNILAVFDDRQRVVDMWRKHNLNVLQVNGGDF